MSIFFLRKCGSLLIICFIRCFGLSFEWGSSFMSDILYQTQHESCLTPYCSSWTKGDINHPKYFFLVFMSGFCFNLIIICSRRIFLHLRGFLVLNFSSVLFSASFSLRFPSPEPRVESSSPS